MKVEKINVGVTTMGLLTGDEYDVMAVPGTEEQLSRLGTAALGEAWTVSRYKDENCDLIRYMPPYRGVPGLETNLKSSIAKCITVADRHEHQSLAISLCDYSRLCIDKRQFFEAIFEGMSEALYRVNHIRQIILITQNADTQIGLATHIETHLKAMHHA